MAQLTQKTPNRHLQTCFQGNKAIASELVPQPCVLTGSFLDTITVRKGHSRVQACLIFARIRSNGRVVPEMNKSEFLKSRRCLRHGSLEVRSTDRIDHNEKNIWHTREIVVDRARRA